MRFPRDTGRQQVGWESAESGALKVRTEGLGAWFEADAAGEGDGGDGVEAESVHQGGDGGCSRTCR